LEDAVARRSGRVGRGRHRLSLRERACTIDSHRNIVIRIAALEDSLGVVGGDVPITAEDVIYVIAQARSTCAILADSEAVLVGADEVSPFMGLYPSSSLVAEHQTSLGVSI